MRIFFLTSTFYPSIGGVEVGIHNLSINMSKLGNEVYVVCPWKANFIPNKNNLPYKIIALPPKFFSLVRYIEFLPIKLIYFIYYFLLKIIYKPDIWHVSMSFPSGFSFMEFAKFSNASYLVRSLGADIQINKSPKYGYRLNKNINKLFENKFRYISNHVAASSCLEKEYLKLGVNKNKIYRIPNGVDLDRFNLLEKKLYKKNNEFINLLSVGRNEPKKNYKKLIDIFHTLQIRSKYKYKLKIIGSKVNLLQNYLDKKNIRFVELIEPNNYDSENEVKDFYNLPSRDILEAYLNADIFVFASLIESFGIVVLEAMAAGLPVVAFDVPGVNELIENDFNGKLVEANNIKTFVEAIISISDKDEINRMSNNSKNISKKYNWKYVANKYLEIYLKIIREK